MKILFRPLLIGLALLALVGAGCAFGGSSKVDTSKDGGVYKSTNSGATWSQATAFPTAKGVGNIGAAEILSLVVDPQDHQVVYAATSENGLLMSYDSGASWQSPKDADLQNGKLVTVAVDPKNVCTIYAASETRLYKSETCGRDFASVYDEARGKIYLRRLAVDWYNEGVVYLALSNGDILKSLNSGKSWTNVAMLKSDITALLINNQDSRVILAGTVRGFWKSTDSAATWVDKTEALESYSSASNIYSIVQDTAGSNWLLSSQYGILRSTDVGETWAGLKLLTSPGQVVIKALGLDSKNTNNIYYATSANFYSTVDGGSNWDTLKLSGSGWTVSTMLIDPEETSVIYLGKEKVK